MARLYQRGDIWYSDIIIKGRRIRKPLSRDKRIAQGKLAEIISLAHSGRYSHPAENLSWSAFKSHYFDSVKGSKSPSTIRWELLSIKVMEQDFQVSRLNNITPGILEQWKGKLKTRGWKPESSNRAVRTIKMIMRKAESWGMIGPQKWGTVPLFKTARGRLLFYTPVDLKKLLDEATGVWRTIALLGARAGLRRAEMWSLQWSDIDLKKGRLHVTPKEGWQPKDHESRWVPLSKDLKAHLAGLSKASEWVLSLQGGNRPTLGAMTTYFKRVVRRAGLKGGIHTLRHTFASHLAMAGQPLHTISRLLGHASVSTTEIYAHLSPDHLDDSILALPKL